MEPDAGGALMAKSPNFWIPRELLGSQAAAQLTGKSLHILLKFYAARQFERLPRQQGRAAFRQTNNGSLTMTYQQVQKDGITNRQFTHALDQNIEVGFLDVAERGAMGHPTKYAISERWRKYGTDDFEKHERTPDRREHKIRAAENARARKARR